MWLIFSNKDVAKNITDEEQINKVNYLFNVSKSPLVIWPFKKAYFSWDMCFLSWQIGIDASTMEIVKWWIVEETRQSCRNLSYVLDENWLSLKDVVKVNIFMKNIDELDSINDVYKNYFILKPARTVVQVSKLKNNALIEIEAIAKR